MDTASRSPGLVLLSAVAVLSIHGCTEESGPPITEYSHTRSPDGTIEAYAYEYSTQSSALTQVMLMFPKDCGSGAVAAYRSGLRLELRWVDDENLEVVHPPGVDFERNASGEILQCYDRKVRVHLVPRAQ